MNPSDKTRSTNRRSFIKQTGAIAAATTLAAKTIPNVHAGEDNLIRLALIGCGGRGNGAVANALNTSDQGPIELYAMADLHMNQIDLSRKSLQRKYGDQIAVVDDNRFIGFDAYKRAIDALRPGDVALCTTRAYVRPLHVEYAVRQGVNVFMEKPFACDPSGLHRMRAAGKEADKNGVRIAAGLQCRHSPARAALIDKIRDGELGDISYVRANRLGGRRWLGDQREKANLITEQLKFGRQNLLWVGSGQMIDNLIHQIDECCWLMDDWPTHCHAMGGREVGSTDRGQCLDTYSMEYTFGDGRKAFCGFRRAEKGDLDFATFVHGTKRAAQFSGNIHRAIVHMYKDLRVDDDQIIWSPTPDAENPWDYEWIDFIRAIRSGESYNECERAVMADYVSLMGRAASHYNRTVTLDEVMQSDFAFCDDVEALDYDSPPPVLADAEGYFPAPEAGKWVEL